MVTLDQQIAEAEASLEALKRQARSATCRELGKHDWKFIGGCHCSCTGMEAGGCFIGVHVCTRCGDCDYGENEENREQIDACDIWKECVMDMTDEEFLRYCETHSQTERAGFVPEHLARLYRLAGYEESALEWDKYQGQSRIISFHEEYAKPLVEAARARLNEQVI